MGLVKLLSVLYFLFTIGLLASRKKFKNSYIITAFSSFNHVLETKNIAVFSSWDTAFFRNGSFKYFILAEIKRSF